MFPEIKTQLEKIERGVVDIFPRDEMIQKLERSRGQSRPLRVKLGVDPTAPDIHLGHGVPLRKLRHFQDLGHQAVMIIGDYTALVGDPSGQNATRPQLTREQIDANAKTYFEQAGKIVDMSRAEVVRNGDWFGKMTFETVIRLAAKMTVARLIERDDFSKRYAAGSPISLHEFLYPMMQGYDSVMVRADVEIGGNDQTFNLLVGRDLQRDAGMEPQVALTMPMLPGTDGVKKMSKSLGNYIGVAEAAEMMYGKIMSIPDGLMRDYFILATDVETSRMDELMRMDNPMEAKLQLARAVTGKYHGDAAAAAAAEHFQRTVRQREVPQDMPEIILAPDMLKDGKIWIVRLLSHCGMAASNSEARRLVQQGGVSVNGETVSSPDAEITPADGMILKGGKRKFGRIKIN